MAELEGWVWGKVTASRWRMERHLGAEVTTLESGTGSVLGCMPQNLQAGLPGVCAEQQHWDWGQCLEWRAALFETNRSFPYSQQQVSYSPDRFCNRNRTFIRIVLSTQVENRVPLTMPSPIYRHSRFFLVEFNFTDSSKLGHFVWKISIWGITWNQTLSHQDSWTPT